MSQIRRIWFASKITGLMSVAAIVHFRVGVDVLYPMAKNDFQGPFSGLATTLEVVVPISIAIIVTATWLWVIYSPTQEEKVRAVGGPPR